MPGGVSQVEHVALTNQRGALRSRDCSPPITGHLGGAGPGHGGQEGSAAVGDGELVTRARAEAGGDSEHGSGVVTMNYSNI